ncbi:MAG: AAA family ATPase, partial [Proteobacteria bacterium]|nr:AAA family ATPase [Pseudomonadota bacterium]
YELGVAQRLRDISLYEDSIDHLKNINTTQAAEILHSKYKIVLSETQLSVLDLVFKRKVVVITGGPGTGKTTLVNIILKTIQLCGCSNTRVKIKLVAPTGRAAKRISEATKMHATTIHRLLEFDHVTAKFRYNEHNKLDCDLIVVDESSMIDIQLMYMLLNALPDYVRLVLIGDIDQIPSVGPGQVLSDIIRSKAVDVVALKKVFRQAANSRIIQNAHAINSGLMPRLDCTIMTNETIETKSDFLFVERETPEDILISMMNFVQRDANRVIKDIDLVRDMQVLSPMQQGPLGVRALNIHLQKLLNPPCVNNSMINTVESGNTVFRTGDKVMHIENDYDKNVFNGDIGYISSVNKDDQIISVNFDGREVIYDFIDLEQLVLAYAITIHKSQGSE